MSTNGTERSCDGCGRVFSAELPPAELGDHRDYCGHCKLLRGNDYEVETQGRRVLASTVADPRTLLDAPMAAPEVGAEQEN